MKNKIREKALSNQGYGIDDSHGEKSSLSMEG